MVKVSHIQSVLFKFKLKGPSLCLPVCQCLEGRWKLLAGLCPVLSEEKQVLEQAGKAFGLQSMRNCCPKIGLHRVTALISAEEQLFGHL